jgi:hypothetical protein
VEQSALGYLYGNPHLGCPELLTAAGQASVRAPARGEPVEPTGQFFFFPFWDRIWHNGHPRRLIARYTAGGLLLGSDQGRYWGGFSEDPMMPSEVD